MSEENIMSATQAGGVQQGFIIGFMVCIDMLRELAMRELPARHAQGMIIFTDSTENDFKNNPDYKVLLEKYGTPESRQFFLAEMLKHAPAE